MNLDRCLLFSWIEEDNIQKAYFRVRPLLTSEGDVRAEADELWPAEGCLRIVPDRNEQHTFKSRMRALGNFCVVDLRGLPADAGKIRTNKNFRPDKGEVNQYILYSDTVKSLPEHSFYEIVEGTADGFHEASEKAATPCFYIKEDDTLYGPVRKEAPEKPDPAQEAAGTLFEMPCPDGKSRLILCMEDAPAPVLCAPVQRSAAPAVQPFTPPVKQPEAAPAPVQSEPQPTAETPAEAAEPVKAETPDPAQPEPVPAAQDTALPIGQKLEILDKSKGYEETLQSLDKPLSQGANLLRQRETRPIQPQPIPAVKPGSLGGTQLVQTPLRTSTPQPKNRVQEIITGHVVGNYEPPAQNLPAGAALRDVANPVENACASLRKAWHATDARDQLLDCMLSLDGFRAKLESRLCRTGSATLMQKVLRDRLQDLEAERLNALCELDRARRDTDAYRDELLNAMKNRLNKEAGQLQKDRDTAQQQLDALKAEVNGLMAQRDALVAKVTELQQDTLPAETARLLAQAQMLSPTMGTPLRMAPAAGQHVPVEDLIARLMKVCADSGIEITRNQAIALLALMAHAPRFGVTCPTIAPVATLARNIAAAFGWKDGFAHQVAAEQRPMVAARPVDSAPAVLMTSLPNYAELPGVTKVLLGRSVPGLTRNAAYDAESWPVLALPQLPFVDALPAPEGCDIVSAASLAALAEDPAANEQAVRTALEPILKAAPPLSGASRRSMFRFISACSTLMEGGLATAADWGVLLWIVPTIDRAGRHYAPVKALLDEYPLSLAAM